MKQKKNDPNELDLARVFVGEEVWGTLSNEQKVATIEKAEAWFSEPPAEFLEKTGRKNVTESNSMAQKKNYWTWCKDCSPFWIYCKDCDEYHTFEEVPCFIDPNIPQLPALPEDERGPPLWTPDMKGTSMEWVFAMQLEHQKRKEVDGCIDWEIMMTLDHSNLEDWV